MPRTNPQHSYTNGDDLPYIKICNPPLKLLIDTGSTKSFLNPDLAKKYFENKITNSKFTVTTIFNKHNCNAIIEIPSFAEFKSNQNLIFHLFKFHNYYDGLIGIDNLRKMKINLNFDNLTLTSPTTKIELCIRNNWQNETKSKTIKPQFVKTQFSEKDSVSKCTRTNQFNFEEKIKNSNSNTNTKNTNANALSQIKFHT